MMQEDFTTGMVYKDGTTIKHVFWVVAPFGAVFFFKDQQIDNDLHLSFVLGTNPSS